MADTQKVGTFIYNLSSIWHKYGLDETRYTGCTLYIMCLKKMIEENTCRDPQYMGKIIELTKILYRPTSVDDIEILKSSVEIVEKVYDLQAGLLSEVFNPVRSQEEGWKKAFLEVVMMVSAIDVEEDGYIPYVESIAYLVGKNSRMGSDKVSSNAVADLLEIAADIKDGDKVLDGTIGYGYSVLKCLKSKKNICLLGVDINSDSIATAALSTILSDIKDYKFMQEDFTAMNSPVGIDKVVMDIPFGMKMGELMGYQSHRASKWMDTDICKETEALFIATAIDSLNDNGRIAVIVPKNFLFKQTKALSTFRKNLVKEGMVKAIVSLPPVYNSTMIKTALLVLQSGNRDVIFVDANDLIQRERRNDAVITNENKILLKSILDEKMEVENVSFLVDNEKLIEVGDWSINMYKQVDDIFEHRSIKEINDDLKKQYKRLAELNNQSLGIRLFN